MWRHTLLKTPEKILLTMEQKKGKYLDACLYKIRHLNPFFVSVDSLLGTEVEATLKILVSCLATKWQQTYSETFAYVCGMFAIIVVQATHRCIRGSWVPTRSISNHWP